MTQGVLLLDRRGSPTLFWVTTLGLQSHAPETTVDNIFINKLQFG